MEREEAHDYMWYKNEECPSMRWGNHATIRDYVDSMIDEIYDSFEQRIEKLESPKTCEDCLYAKFPLEPICYKWERGKPDYYELKESK